MEIKYFSLFSRIEDLLKNLSPGSSLIKCQNKSDHTVTPVKIRLPEIEINSFTNKISEWQPFFQLFNSLIVNDSRLSDFQKFIYLKSYLRNEPLNLIEDLPIDGNSLPIAIHVLEARYDSKLTIVNAYFKSLFIELKTVIIA